MIERVTHIARRGSVAVSVVPPKPCGLTACVGEIEVTPAGTNMPIRVHLDGSQRAALVAALGGRPAYDPELADRLEHNGRG